MNNLSQKKKKLNDEVTCLFLFRHNRLVAGLQTMAKGNITRWLHNKA